MKITKKMRKKANGMNQITKQHFESGYEPPTYRNKAPVGQVADFVKVKRGTPYVNPINF